MEPPIISDDVVVRGNVKCDLGFLELGAPWGKKFAKSGGDAPEKTKSGQIPVCRAFRRL